MLRNVSVALIFIVLSASCGPLFNGGGKDKAGDKDGGGGNGVITPDTKIDKALFIKLMTDVSRQAKLVDYYDKTEAEVAALTTDEKLKSEHKVLLERKKDNFCRRTDDHYTDGASFTILTFVDSAKPEDERKNCPIQITSYAKKKIPTAGQVLWTRDTNIGQGPGDIGEGKSIYFSASSPHNLNSTTATSITYDVTGHVNATYKFKGTAEIAQKAPGTSVSLEIKMALSFDFANHGTIELNIDSSLDVASNKLLSIKYTLNGTEIAADEMKDVAYILEKTIAWNWPSRGP